MLADVLGLLIAMIFLAVKLLKVKKKKEENERYYKNSMNVLSIEFVIVVPDSINTVLNIMFKNIIISRIVFFMIISVKIFFVFSQFHFLSLFSCINVCDTFCYFF